VGAANPQVDRFLISHHATDAGAIDDINANAYVAIARAGGDGGAPITGFVRPYVSETSAPPTNNTSVVDTTYGGPSYVGETIVSSFRVNDAGGVNLETGGSLDTQSAVFRDFKVQDHFGTVETRGSASWKYHAKRVTE